MTDDAAIRRHRRRLAIPVAIAVLLLGGYTMLWFQGARIMRTEIARWVAAERAEGRTVAYGDVRVRGYPGSLRAEVEAPVWADPGAWAWRAERLFVITEPFDPRRLVLTPRGEQRAEYGGGAYALRADDLRVGLEEGAVTVEMAGLTAEDAAAGDVAASDGARTLAIGAGRAAWSEGPGGAGVLGLSFGQVAYADGEAAYYVPQLNAALSEVAGRDLGLDAFEGAVATAKGAPAALIAGQGRLTIGDDGYPAGRLDVTVRNADALSAVLIQAGVLDAAQGGMVDMAMGMFGSGEGEATLPLSAQDGALRVGPVAVADLPRF